MANQNQRKSVNPIYALFLLPIAWLGLVGYQKLSAQRENHTLVHQLRTKIASIDSSLAAGDTYGAVRNWASFDTRKLAMNGNYADLTCGNASEARKARSLAYDSLQKGFRKDKTGYHCTNDYAYDNLSEPLRVGKVVLEDSVPEEKIDSIIHALETRYPGADVDGETEYFGFSMKTCSRAKPLTKFMLMSEF
ncbi:MAG: hypothetical protein NTX24_04875 [Candidatus Pacearchaeota archaeon]|nr:hypothetical protein [Candidatus Pacearchaeota archaeon]